METGVENGMETAPERTLDVGLPSGAPFPAVTLLGPMSVVRPTSPSVLPASRKARGLLAYLIMARRPLHRSRLCEIFWDGPNDPRSELRWCLTKIRAVLDDVDCKRVRADKDYISIDVSTMNVDALRIERDVEAAVAGSDVQALERLATSFGGEFLDGLVAERIPLFESWLIAQRERYGTWHAKVLGRTGELLPQGSDLRIATLRKRIDLHPDDLSGHRDLLTALAASGRIAEGDAHLSLARKLLRHDGINHASLDRVWQTLRQQVFSPEPIRAGKRQPSDHASIEAAPRASPFLALSGLPSGGIPASNLPPQLTSYIGRSVEESEVRSRLSLHRLVTLTGPGGAGKTRLAVEIGRLILADTPDGVWLVELAPVNDPLIVADVVCSSIGVAVADGHTAIDSAVAYLRHKKALLVLDNCEHLLDSVAALTLALLLGCPTLSVLATSRERLGVVGERTYQVPGLTLPVLSGPMTAEAARQHDAVRLFEERAKVAVQGFVLSDANAEAVTNICIQLDGIPMAIELVVPQLRMIQPQGLATRLRDRVLLDMQGERTTLPRHRTLAALFDWSYILLSEPEQALFRRLSIFAGGWSLEAATSVTSDDAVASDTVFDLLSRLVDKSLVFADLRGTVPRYGYLETARQYAFVKHKQQGDEDRHRRLAAYMVELFSASDATWSTTPTEQWLAMYEPDIDNLRASLDWAFGPGGDVPLGIELCCYSLRLWDDLALLAERERWFATAFHRRDAQTPARILARLCLGRLSNSAHGDRTNFDLAIQASELFRDAGEPQGIGEALAKAGAALEAPDTTALAMPYLEKALEVLRPAGPSKPLASCLRSLAIACYFTHDFVGARPLLRQSEAVAKAVGDLRGAAAVQLAAAELTFAEGSTEEAIDITNAMLSGGKCNRRQKVLGLTNLAAYLLAVDRVEDARRVAQDALHEALALDWQAAIVRLVEHLALVAILTDQPAQAARMLGYCVAFYDTGAASREYTELATFNRLSALVSSVVPQKSLQQLRAEGAAWSGDQAAQSAFVAAGFEN